MQANKWKDAFVRSIETLYPKTGQISGFAIHQRRTVYGSETFVASVISSDLYIGFTQILEIILSVDTKANHFTKGYVHRQLIKQ